MRTAISNSELANARVGDTCYMVNGWIPSTLSYGDTGNSYTLTRDDLVP